MNNNSTLERVSRLLPVSLLTVLLFGCSQNAAEHEEPVDQITDVAETRDEETGALVYENAEERIDKVIAHIRNNPISELPIRNHPVYPERVFCRLFNISLSARAYFQLMTDPSLDQQSNEDVRKVAQWYLDNPNKVEDPDSAYWAGEYHSVIVAKFGSQGTERKGAITRDTEKLLMEYMVSYLDFWSRPALYQQSIEHETFHYWASENHWWQEIVTGWGYLLALQDDPEFKDTTLADGLSVQDHYELTSDYMKRHMQQRARKGFLTEISSGGYSGRMHNMWYTIFDLTPDDNMRLLARNTLDLWWSFWAEEQISGERGGGKVRHRRLKGLLPHGESAQIPAWLLFGIGSMDYEQITAISPDSIRVANAFMLMFSNYRPDEIVHKILEDREHSKPYAITQRRLGRSLIPYREFDPFIAEKGAKYDFESGDNLKYSWVSPNFVLGTVMRPPVKSGVWHPGSAQGWWHGLLIRGDANDDFPERVVPTIINNQQIQRADYYGDQYAIQSEGSFMTRRLNDEFWEIDNATLPMGMYLSKGLRSMTEHDGRYLFIEDNHAWVAIRAVGTEFSNASNILQKKHSKAGDFFKLDNEDMPIIIEVADVGDYENFQAFKAAAKQANLTSADGVHTYASLSGDVLTMFDDRSYPRINGEEIDYNPDIAYRSRYVFSEWDSGIVRIDVGEDEKTLDFAIH